MPSDLNPAPHEPEVITTVGPTYRFKPVLVAHREQVPDAIRIPPAACASAATVADRAPAQFAIRTFIVRLMSQGSEIRNREIHT